MLRPYLINPSLTHNSLRRSSHLLSLPKSRTVATGAPAQKRAGDISDAFVSLSRGASPIALEPRFAQLKKRLISSHEAAIAAAWPRLLSHLREQIEKLRDLGSKSVPEISFSEIAAAGASSSSNHHNPSFAASYKERGVCVVRGVLGEQEALGLKAAVRDYIRKNPHTKAFPASNPQVWELYWSPSQLRARSHPNFLSTQRYLMGFWHADDHAPVSMDHPISYADRLRLRQPGDTQFALGPHIDGGSVERWEEGGYGLGGDGRGVYSDIWRGEWEKYDPWDAGVRLGVISDLYQGVGACSMFRMAQGWLSMSNVSAGEGHLKVNPMLKGATAYVLMRPFFEAKRTLEQLGAHDYLSLENWKMESDTTVNSFYPTTDHR